MTTENKGFLKTWKDDRGFGFIKPADGSEDIFIHISALGEGARRPHRGDIIFYQIEHSEDGKTKAVNATIQGGLSRISGGKWLWIIFFSLLMVGTFAIAIILGLVSFESLFGK